MGVVRRAVDRIEHPAGPGRHRRAAAHLFGQHLVIGKSLGDELAEHPLDRHVDLGDQIDRALLVDAHVAAEARHLHVAGAHDRLDRGGEKQWIAGHSGSARLGGRRADGALDHADFHAALRRALQLHVVHEVADEEDAAAARL